MNYVPLLFRFLIGFCRLNWEKYRILKFICQQSFSTMHWLDGGLIGRDVEKITAISRVNGKKWINFSLGPITGPSFPVVSMYCHVYGSNKN